MANSVDPDLIAPIGAVCSGSTLFVFIESNIRVPVLLNSVLDLGLISIVSLGPSASTKVESHVNFTEPLKVSQPIFFFAMLNTKKLAFNFNFNIFNLH